MAVPLPDYYLKTTIPFFPHILRFRFSISIFQLFAQKFVLFLIICIFATTELVCIPSELHASHFFIAT